VTGFFIAFWFYDVTFNTGRGNPENPYKTLYPVAFTYIFRQSSVAGREQETKNAFTNGK